MASYIGKGRHDIGWSKHEDGPTPHMALCIRFFATYLQLRDLAEVMLAFTNQQVEEIVQWAAGFEVPIMFTSERGRFIVEQVSARRDTLKEALGL